jgi:hypothetical protein
MRINCTIDRKIEYFDIIYPQKDDFGPKDLTNTLMNIISSQNIEKINDFLTHLCLMHLILTQVVELRAYLQNSQAKDLFH